MTLCDQFASLRCPLMEAIQSPSGDCQGCIRLQAEIAVLRSDFQGLRDKNAKLMEVVQVLERAIASGKL